MKKEERNCGSYPVYPNYYGGMPGPLPMGGMPMAMPSPYTTTFDSYDSSLSNQVKALEQRVTNLENMLGNSSYSSTSYNSTNYQMM